MNNSIYEDDIFILRVQTWQTVDKFAVCFSRVNGKVSFIAYGAKYPKNMVGRLIQPFAQLHGTFTRGRRYDTIKQGESVSMPNAADFEYIAYGAVVAEVIEKMTADGEVQEEVYQLLVDTFALLSKHNKRIVVLAALCQFLHLSGYAPLLDYCSCCQTPVAEDGYFEVEQGYYVCPHCVQGEKLQCSMDTIGLYRELSELDLANPASFGVKGKALMELEKIIASFIIYEIGGELKSLQFLAQI